LGNTDATFNRYGGGQRRIHLSIPELEFMARRPKLFYIDFDAFLCVAKGIEDGNILFKKKGETSGAAVYDRTRT